MGEGHSTIGEGRERQGCVVLHSMSVYSSEHDALLRQLIDECIDVFAVVGVDCAAWEDAMDWLCVELDGVTGEVPGAFCMTSSHPRETLGEVVTFAEDWCSRHGWPMELVRVITV